MCNPRRVLITLNRTINESWSEAIEHLESASSDITVTDRLSTEVHLNEQMGDNALDVMHELLDSGFNGWEPSNKGFQKRLNHLTIIYTPENRMLHIESSIKDMVRADIHKKQEVEGSVDREIKVSGEGIYYDDGSGGYTPESAEKDAQKNGEETFKKQSRQVLKEERKKSLQEARIKLEEETKEELRLKLESEKRKKEEILRSRIREMLYASQDEVQGEINLLMGETYKNTLLRIVEQYGGEIVKQQETGSVINMEAVI